jgi:hypothetical protein
MNINGKDIEMQHPICYDKVYDKWLVSRCGKVWTLHHNRLLSGAKVFNFRKGGKYLSAMNLTIRTPIGFWGDGSGNHCGLVNKEDRKIRFHKVVMDTWAPLYDNPPEGIVWEEWEIVRDLPTVYNYISKTVVIDHINDDPTNNHLDNLRRTTSWDNNSARKSKGI